MRLGIQERIREKGLKTVQIEWDSETKPGLEMGLRNIDQFQLGLSAQEKDFLKRKIKEFIQAVEGDIYPGRRSKRNWLIGGAIVLVIVAIGLGIWFWRRKKKSNF